MLLCWLYFGSYFVCFFYSFGWIWLVILFRFCDEWGDFEHYILIDERKRLKSGHCIYRFGVFELMFLGFSFPALLFRSLRLRYRSSDHPDEHKFPKIFHFHSYLIQNYLPINIHIDGNLERNKKLHVHVKFGAVKFYCVLQFIHIQPLSGISHTVFAYPPTQHYLPH